ncbi:hypothetical protein WJX72_001741 [[Myrmecia] bisecta]|uniref:Translation initiation factor eIF2B subunit gamma n=1 Tax=[Myrmecia] bisecta TaxID=41462 RepID=A0AAW1R5G3_9CHLO
MALQFQAVVLAGSIGSQLYPLNSTGTPKALLPIGNQHLITYPLQTLEEGGIKDVLVLCQGETASAKVSSWIAKNYQGPLHLEVKSVPEDSGTADALRTVRDKLKGANIVVISGDLVADVPLKAIMATHYVNQSTATSLLAPRKTSPSSETKPGKAPKDVDYIGMDEAQKRLLFFASSPEMKSKLRVPLTALKQFGQLTVRTDFVDVHLYVFNLEAMLTALDTRPAISSIKQDLVPHLVRNQFSGLGRQPCAQSGDSASTPTARVMASPFSAAPVQKAMEILSLGEGASSQRGFSVFLASKDQFCMRARDVHSYREVNKEITAPELALRLLQQKPNPKHDNYVHESVQLGTNKTTVGAGCIIGPATILSDKCSVKRSVIGGSCKLGTNVKVLNSVIMDSVTIEEGCHLQNTVVCAGAHLKAKSTLNKCIVGPDYIVAETSDLRDEVVAKSRATH